MCVLPSDQTIYSSGWLFQGDLILIRPHQLSTDTGDRWSIRHLGQKSQQRSRRGSVFSKISIRKITYSHVAQKSPVFNMLCILSRRHRLNDDHNAPDLPPHWQPISLIFVMHIYILLRVVGAIDRKLTTVNGLENNNNKYLRIDTTKNTPHTRGFGSTAVCSVVLEHRGRW